MRAKAIRVTGRGLRIEATPDSPAKVDDAAMRMVSQRMFTRRRVPLEHNGGMPIVKRRPT